MKQYRVKDEYIDKWIIDADSTTVTDAEIRRLSHEWDVPVKELMEQVETVSDAGNLEMLSEARQLLNLNQKELGVYIGVSNNTVNNWMTKRRACPTHIAEMALRLARFDAERLENGETTSQMVRWSLVSSTEYGEWLTVCGSKADAIREGQMQWSHLTENEKRKVSTFEVALVKVQIVDKFKNEPRFSYYCDESGRCDADILDIAKDWIR